MRHAKALMNMGLTKTMSSNHNQAMEICDRSLPIVEQLVAANQNLPEQTESVSRKQHMGILFKYYHKRATLLKRSSSFRQSMNTLLDLEARIKQHIETIED